MFAQFSRLLIIAVTLAVMATYSLASPVALNNMVVVLEKRILNPIGQKVENGHVLKDRSIGSMFQGDYSGEHPRDGLKKEITTRDEVIESGNEFENSPLRHTRRPGGGLEKKVVEVVDKREPKRDEEESFNWSHGSGRFLSPWDQSETDTSHISTEKKQNASKRWVNSAKSQGWTSENDENKSSKE